MKTLHCELHLQALEIAKKFRKSEAELIEVLEKIDREKVYLEYGFPSLFAYAVSYLKLSEANAYNFIQVARKSREIPELKTQISNGNLCVSKARKILPVLTQENHSEWIEKAVQLPKAQLEKEVAAVRPEAEPKESLRYISSDRLSLKLGISEENMKKLKRAQSLLVSKAKRQISLEETLGEVLEVFLKQKDPVKKAERSAKTPTQLVPGRVEEISKIQKKKEKAGKIDGYRLSLSNSVGKRNLRRRIPNALKHQIVNRDSGLCQFVGVDGQKCHSDHFMELHHQQPVAVGGKNTFQNLVSLCGPHHKFMHSKEHYFTLAK